jgi:hypothetical protein
MQLCSNSCAVCISNRKGRTNAKGHWGYQRRKVELWESAMSVLRKRDTRSASDTAGGPLSPDLFSTAYPGLLEMLSSVKWPDGSRRASSTLLIFLDQGQAKLCLNDRDQGLTAWVSGSSISEALASLEASLQTERLEWRKPTGNTKRQR